MSNEKPYVEVDLSGYNTPIIRVPTQEHFIGQLVTTLRYFFGKGEDTFADHFPSKVNEGNFPFKGFILHGPPGSGKTEAVIEAGRRLRDELGTDEGLNVKLFHVNSSNINRSAVGEMELRLQRVFSAASDSSSEQTRTIILFDDIETLLTKRTDSHSREWTRSLNGVFFHELDRLFSTRVMVVATTNVPEMIDPAVHSRLASRSAPAPTIDEMIQVARSALPSSKTKNRSIEELLEDTTIRIKKNIANGSPASFRLARQSAIETLLNLVAGWEEK